MVEENFSEYSMLDLFSMELGEQITFFNENLLVLEQRFNTPLAELQPCLEVLMRAAHSLKGAAKIVGLDGVARVAHRLEDCFVAMQQGELRVSDRHLDIFFGVVDWFTSLHQVSDSNLSLWLENQAETMQGLLQELGEVMGQGSVAPAIAPTTTLTPSPPGSSMAEGHDFSELSMFELFHLEVATQTTLFNENLLLLESRLGAPTEEIQPLLEELMRAAHSIKGAASILDFEGIVRVAHGLEDCFVAAQRGDLYLGDRQIDVLFTVVDWLTSLQQITNDEISPWLATQGTAIAHLVTQLNTITNPPTVNPGDHPPTPEPEQKPPGAASPPKAQADNIPINRAIRVSTTNLNQIMALAGESVVESHWLQRFGDSTLHLRRQQQNLMRHLDQLQQTLPLDSPALSELSKAKKIALDSYALLGDRLSELEQFSRRFDQLSENLYREVIASHMRPFADGIQAFPRMVRDLGKELGKKVQLEIIGLSVKVDRDILERLETPLTHMLRNAVSHGIETPMERLAAGKPEVGTIRLEAKHRAGMLTITLEDDGKGIDLEHLRQKIIQKRLATAEMAAQLNDPELLEFLFLPGFSTTTEITEISGRGVGLDIAKTMVQDVGGLLRAQTELGKSTTFHFQLPLTLSVIRALLVEIGGEPYAFNLNRIDRVLMVNIQAIATTENKPYIVVEGENISLVNAQQILELPTSPPEFVEDIPVILLSDHTHRYAVIVERFLGERDLVVRPLDPRLGKVQDVSAAAIAENGQPILIIDVADLVRTIDNLVTGGNVERLQNSVTHATATKTKQILVVDDSITVREMERKLLQNQGYQVDVAVNGMEGWNTARSGNYDLIITDIDMPRMNGIELVQHLKGHPQLKSIPIIIVSYKDREEDQLAGLDAGADYYLTKSSFHDNSLIHAVVDLIGVA